MATDPQTLLDQASCYSCFATSQYTLELMELALLAQIVAAGGGGGGAVSCGAADPVAAPSGTCGVYVNTTSGQIFWFYSGAWH